MRFAWNGAALLAVLPIVLSAAACNRDKQNCSEIPGTAPTCVSGTIDERNRPPGPPNGELASATYGIYEGDCPAAAESCAGKLAPTEDSALQIPGRQDTYILKSHQQRYTVRLCVTHPNWPGRKIGMWATARLDSVRPTPSPFDEGDPAKKSPVCISLPFDMTIPGIGVTNTGTGEVGMNENSQDLLTANEWRRTFGLRVAGTR